MTFKEVCEEARKIRHQRGAVAALQYVKAWHEAKRDRQVHTTETRTWVGPPANLQNLPRDKK